MTSKNQPACWLLKTEPETYSFEQLLKDKRTPWNGVRNFQARNFIKSMKPGDLAIIYHSGDSREAVGLAEVITEAYPDKSASKNASVDAKSEWFQVDLKPLKIFPSPVTLAAIKANSKLTGLPLIRHTRLSVMPVPAEHQQELFKMAKLT